MLEHHATVGTRLGDLLAVDPGFAAGRRHEAGNDGENGRLAAARGADQRYELAGLHVETDVLDGDHLVVVGAEDDAHVADVDKAFFNRAHFLLPGAKASQGIMRMPHSLMIPLQTSPRTPIVIMPSTIAG